MMSQSDESPHWRLTPLDEPGIDLVRARFGQPRGTGHVGSIIAAGFEAYAKTLHPPSLPDRHGDLKPASWSQLAEALGVELDSTTKGSCLVDRYRLEVGRVEEPFVGTFTELIEIGDRINYRLRVGELVSSLSTSRRDPVGIGLSTSSALGALGDGLPCATLGIREFLLATLDDPIDLVSGPQMFTGMVWASDLSWWIATDVDLDYTLVAGSAALIDTHLADPRFESLTIPPSS